MNIVLCTVSNADEGKQIAQTIVKEGLCACVNQVPSITSYYIYEGKFCEDNEELLIIKSLKTTFDKLSQRITELHSYDVPEIVSINVDDVDEKYLKWVKDSVDDK